jgi:hypothetical protein
MKRTILLKIAIGIMALAVLLLIVDIILVEPWAAKKIQSEFNASVEKYQLEIEKVHITIFKSGIELENVVLISMPHNDSLNELKVEIESIKFIGINLAKALLRKDIDIRELNISNSHVTGKLPFQKKAGPAKASPLNINIKTLIFDRLDVDIKDIVTSNAFSLHNAVLKVYDLQLVKSDTISKDIFRQFDFNAQQQRTRCPIQNHCPFSGTSIYRVDRFISRY